MEEACVVGVARMFGGYLPVAVDELALNAEYRDRAAHDPLDMLGDERTEIVRQRLHFLRECRENQPIQRFDAQLDQAMLLEIEIRRHPPLALAPAAERDAHEVSVQFISPLMKNKIGKGACRERVGKYGRIR